MSQNDERPYQAADVYNATRDIKLYEWVASIEAELVEQRHKNASTTRLRRRMKNAQLEAAETRKELDEARKDAAYWEARYDELLVEIGGVSPG